MAVGDLIDHDYVATNIYSFGEETVDLANDPTNEYLYFHCYGLQFYAYQRYHLTLNREAYFYLYAWDYSTDSWDLQASSSKISEQESIGFGANRSAPSATASYSRYFTTDLWKIRHNPTAGSYYDMWYDAYSGLHQDVLLRMRGTTIVEGWTTNSDLNPNNHSAFNTDNQRGNELTDSLKTRIMTHP